MLQVEFYQGFTSSKVKYFEMITSSFINHGHARQCKQKKTWMIFFVGFFSFFKRFVPSGISRTNCHLLILDGHGFHATLKSIEQTQDFGLIMITLLFHTSHTVIVKLSCYKSLKTTFKRERDGAMVKISYT